MLMALAAGLTLVPAVTVDARAVTAGDLVRGAGGARLGGPAATRVVLRLPAGRRHVALPAAAALALVRRAGVVAHGTDPVSITLRSDTRAAPGCWASTRALAAGEPVTVRDAVPAACGEEAVAIGSVGGEPVVRDAVAAGAPLGRLVPAAVARIAAGTALLLRSTAGPVTIERAVTTMQPGRSGRRVFVRNGDGEVFAAPLAMAEEAR